MLAMMDLSLSWWESSIRHGRHCWPTRIITAWPLDSNSWNPPFLRSAAAAALGRLCGAVLRRDRALRSLRYSNRIARTQRSFQCFRFFFYILFFFQANFGSCCWLTWILQFSQTSQNNSRWQTAEEAKLLFSGEGNLAQFSCHPVFSALFM